MRETLDVKAIATLRDLPDMVPVLRDSYVNWSIRVFNRQINDCRNYLSPNRRDFYKILMISGGEGIFTLGLHKYIIEQPTILFLHPNDIISWQSSSGEPAGYYVLFKKDFINSHPMLKSTMERFGLFTDKPKSVIRLDQAALESLNRLWESIYAEQEASGDLGNEAIQAYMQLLMIDAVRNANFPAPDATNMEFNHIHTFFNLLEEEASHINYEKPIKLRTAKEFAYSMELHPNYLNRILKKYTGQNVSTHIKSRILEECKVLLTQTSWTLEEISYSVGFSDQPNFNFFFKKNTGLTPTEFRKSQVVS